VVQALPEGSRGITYNCINHLSLPSLLSLLAGNHYISSLFRGSVQNTPGTAPVPVTYELTLPSRRYCDRMPGGGHLPVVPTRLGMAQALPTGSRGITCDCINYPSLPSLWAGKRCNSSLF